MVPKDEKIIKPKMPDEGLRLDVLLKWEFSRHGTQIKIAGIKIRALLTYLLLDQRLAHRRDALARLFWPGKEMRKARASLRQSLLEIDRAFSGIKDVIEATKDEISVSTQDVSSDLKEVHRLLEYVTEEQRHPGFDSSQLLNEFLGISEDFDMWIEAQRDFALKRVQTQLATVFNDITQGFNRRARSAILALGLDEFDEDAVRALMLCQSGQNNSALALRTYDRFFKRLEEFMDAEPSPKTQDLAVKIKLLNEPGAAPLEDNVTSPSAAVSGPADTFVKTTIAVLPFECLGGPDLPDYVLLGILDQITCHLSSFKAPAAISSNSTRRYLGLVPEPARVGVELGANYVVSGVIRPTETECQVSIQLAETRGARVIWASTRMYDKQSLLGFDTTLAEHIASVVVPNVNVSELNSTRERAVTELQPYHLVLRAKELVFQFTQDSIGAANELIERAVTLSPYFAPAHTLRAESYAISMWQGWSDDPGADRRKMDAHLRQAILVAPDFGRALALWGHNRHMFDRETTGPLKLFDRAVTLSPNDSETLIWTVPGTCMNGFASVAIERALKAINLSPLDPFQFRNEHFLSLAYYMNGDFDTSAEYGMSSFNLAPNYSSNLRATIAALVSAGRLSETTELVEQHALVEPHFSVQRFIPTHGIRDPHSRARFGETLIEAGLPK